MDVDNHGNGGPRSLSEEERLKIKRLAIVNDELKEEYDRLYIDFKYLRSRHEEVVRTAKELERKHSEMDNRTYRKPWRKFYEEEVTLQELGTTIRQYAEKVRKNRAEVWQTIERLMGDGA